MKVTPLPAVTDGLVRYRITAPERPGRYAVLDVPADAEDPIGLVELFAGTHLHLLDWSLMADENGDEPTTDRPPRERRFATG